jgi:hypothetical protein
MAYNNYTNTSTGGGCPTLPPCPACGGLECLCRPRFYAGQRLNEEDLNRLENYVVAKNKLHNRYLNGWGVVCGLEVVCSPCGNTVRVKPGYALSPCGEDINVCKDDTVDVCALTQACRPASTPDCQSNWQSGEDNCKEATEDWILAICYDEKQSRGSPSLARAGGTASCSRCGCGGSSACGCSCHSSNGKTGSNFRPSPSVQTPQCEPTLICEGYTYRVYKAPKPNNETKRNPGAFVDRVTACLKELAQQLTQFPNGQNITLQEQVQWCCNFKQTLYDFLVSEGAYQCQLADKLAAVRVPDANTDNFPELLQEAQQQLLTILWEFIRYCFCSALLPPCPDSVMTDCVPLATITVRRHDCKILQVCNLGVRKYAVTLPNLGYWLSILSPFLQGIIQALEGLCCKPFDLRGRTPRTIGSLRTTAADVQTAQPNIQANPEASSAITNADNTSPPEGELLAFFHQVLSFFGANETNTADTPNVVTKAAPATSVVDTTVTTNSKMPPQQELTTLLYKALLNPDRGFDAKALLLFNMLGAKDAKGNPLLSDLESRNPAQFLLFNQVIAPLIRSSIPASAGTAANLAHSSTGVADANSAQAAEIARLSKMVEELTKKVDKLSHG